MAEGLSRKFLLLATAVLLLAGQRSAAQLPPPPTVFVPKKMPEAAPAAKELSPPETDVLMEKAFGEESAELKRPIRVWIPDKGLIAADKATISGDGRTVRFTPGSIGLVHTADGASTFRGDAIVVVVAQPVKAISELPDRRGITVTVHQKNATIALDPANLNTAFRTEIRTRNARVMVQEKFAVQIAVPKGAALPAMPAMPAPVEAPRDFSTATPNFTTTALPPGPAPVEVRFTFKIDPVAPLTDLLPTPVKLPVRLPHWTNEDLTKVPELTFGTPLSRELSKQNATEKTAHAMAKINHLNRKKTDGFMLAMIEQRTDLHGLPFRMGDDCRTREKEAKIFAVLATLINQGLVAAKNQASDTQEFSEMMGELVGLAQAGGPGNDGNLPRGSSPEQVYRATVAAAMQILMPESASLRVRLAKGLATIPHIDATKALAKLAIFSPEDEVRAAAIDALKLRRERDYTDVLMQGFRYPLPAVSKRAAEALVKLERKDLLANLVEVLESPDPRLPITENRDGKDVTVVREMVKVNHHRNCLLCHAPGNTDNTPEGVLKVAVPLPGEPLAKPSEGGYQSTPPPTPDIVVRIDMTYLRQDFSLMMPVSDAHPWPEMQRFDFLVRTRALTAAEAQAYEPCCEDEEPGRLSPYHRAALYALRELTGRDTEPTATAWRKMLKLTAR